MYEHKCLYRQGQIRTSKLINDAKVEKPVTVQIQIVKSI